MGADAYKTADDRQKPVKCPICGQDYMVNEGTYYECTLQGCEGRIPARRAEDKAEFEARVKAKERSEEEKELKKKEMDWGEA